MLCYKSRCFASRTPHCLYYFGLVSPLLHFFLLCYIYVAHLILEIEMALTLMCMADTPAGLHMYLLVYTFTMIHHPEIRHPIPWGRLNRLCERLLSQILSTFKQK
jgi:hypothetical protein